MLLTLENVSFGYDDKRILEHIGFTISEGERIGLIGPNGEGKTTLLKLMSGALAPDEGKVLKKSGLKIGYLEQNGGLESARTVYEEMQTVFSDVHRAMDAQREIAAQMTAAEEGSDAFRALSARYEQLDKRIAAQDGYHADVRIRTVLNGMGFGDMYGQKISDMSGGEKTRLKLCRLLLEQPDILFLDEPTNHLDVSTLFWLESYLKNYRGALFTVSHDRYFLDATVGKIFELENCRVRAFRGNYSKYKILKAEQYEHDLREYEKQQEEIAALEDYVARNIVRATTAKSAAAGMTARTAAESPCGSLGRSRSAANANQICQESHEHRVKRRNTPYRKMRSANAPAPTAIHTPIFALRSCVFIAFSLAPYFLRTYYLKLSLSETISERQSFPPSRQVL